MKRLSRWWWSLEESRWLAVRVMFLIVMVPAAIVVVAVAAWREAWPVLVDAVGDTLKGPRRS